ncbi:hypothetical protein C9374_003133 [Naegleria lovaniensis]|uniref:F-box domain-containing protein n=1 Tax=Naegleria lovaniensis TaxID=51637 RepID=A0AA88GUH1_NAELO|nr:uncharacterized protein C9374_003133 [Naegleria lovaniensis]KAG2385984.1 hypothetical protein C9374_003133 [Naegleria lovaniensis]
MTTDRTAGSFVDLNEDVLINILSFIPTNHLFQVQTVNKVFSKISEHDMLWKRFYKEELALLHNLGVKDDPVQSNFKKHLKQIYERTISQIEAKLTKQLVSTTKHKNIYYSKDEILNYEPQQDLQKDRFRIVITGDGCIGKTSMFIKFATGKFPDEYIPTVFDHYVMQSKWNSKYALELVDTESQDYERLRPLAYLNSDLCFIAFSCLDTFHNGQSFINVAEKWIASYSHFAPQGRMILVATKCDLRNNTKLKKEMLFKRGIRAISVEQGELMAQQMGCITYIETSAKDGIGFDRLDELVLKSIAIPLRANEHKKNCFLQ